MLTYKHKKSGRTQQVEDREKVRISILERSGWQRVDEPTPGVASASPAGDDSPKAKEMRAEAAAKDAKVDAMANNPDAEPSLSKALARVQANPKGKRS